MDGSNAQEPVNAWFPGDDLLRPTGARRGLPIGNLTSQWFANWYLDGLDHAVTSRLGVGGYVRYCDDFILLDDDRGRLHGGAGPLPGMADGPAAAAARGAVGHDAGARRADVRGLSDLGRASAVAGGQRADLSTPAAVDETQPTPNGG